MKNYKLIAELMKLPAGYDVEFATVLLDEEYTVESNGSTVIDKDVSDIEVDSANEKITLLA